MPTVLLATADPESEIARAVRDRLRRNGFSSEVTTPVLGLPEKIATLCQVDGRIDAVVLLRSDEPPMGVSNFDFLSRITNPDDYEAAIAIRKLNADLLFQGLVRARTVPIVCHLLSPATFPPPPKLPWFTPVAPLWGWEVHPARVGLSLVRAVVDAVRKWRRDLLRELDHVGFAVVQSPDGYFSVSEALARKHSDGGEILGPKATPLSLRRANIYLAPSEAFDQARPLRELEFLLNHFRQIAKKKGIQPETVFQRFFERNPSMLYRGLHGRHWPKPILPC